MEEVLVLLHASSSGALQLADQLRMQLLVQALVIMMCDCLIQYCNMQKDQLG